MTGTFSLAIMGQTGVGKTSLLNALFGTNLDVDPVMPTTREPQTVPVELPGGGILYFTDLPGIGESEKADAGYLRFYAEHCAKSDVVLWAVHADSRSLAFDRRALEDLLASSRDPAALVRKLTIVLTKADLLSPPPWIYRMDAVDGLFVPDPKIEKRLRDKASLVDAVLGESLEPYAKDMIARTFNDSGFTGRGPLSIDGNIVRYNGKFTTAELEKWTAKYPRHHQIFARLHNNHQVLFCSSLFRYNLTQLMIAIVNKLSVESVGRYLKLNAGSRLDRVAVEEAKRYNNIVVVDGKTGDHLFDLTRLSLREGR